MSQKRDRAPRAPKRLKVRFGVDRFDKMAFTRNLSATGICLRTNQVLKPGTTVQMEILGGDRRFNMWAKVVWAKQVPHQLAHVLDCGMGFRLIDPGAEWVEFCEQWKAARSA